MKSNQLNRFLRYLLAAIALSTVHLQAMAENRSDLWWNPAESGRGLIVIDHETDLYVVWCTYTAIGTPTWYVIPGGKLSDDRRVFEGTLYQTYSWGYGEVEMQRALPIGSAMIDFSPEGLAPGSARFSMPTPSGQLETHDLTRLPFGTGSPNWGSDATDLWWDNENVGWGVAVIQHGTDIFAVALTYEYAGSPTFFVAPAPQRSAENPDQFSGTMYATTAAKGPFDPAQVQVHDTGYALMRFATPLGDTRPGTMNFSMEAAWVPQPVLRRLPFGLDRP